MIKNYILIIVRSFSRQKLFFVINFLGLTLGLTAFTLISFFSYDEMQYEKFHNNYSSLYRLYLEGDSTSPPWRGTPALLAPLLYQNIPEIKNYIRLAVKSFNTIQVGDKLYYEKSFSLADSSFFTSFSFKLIKGSPKDVLSDPSYVVITQSIANKLFGENDPIGKEIIYNNNLVFKVSGVALDPPRHSHIGFHYVVSFKNLNKIFGENAENCWGCYNYTSYVLLKAGSDSKSVSEKIKKLQLPTSNGKFLNLQDIALQPFKDIHFMYVRGNEFSTIDRFYIMALVAAALVIVLIACVNYNNLSLARALHRLRETGIRKVVGANKAKLIFQFTAESVVFVLLSLIFSIVLIEGTLPKIIEYTGIQYEMNYSLLPYLIIFSVIVGIISGLYPALFLSSFSPYEILKGKFYEGGSVSIIRNILISFQFIASIILLSCSLIIAKQLNYIQNADLGMDTKNLISIDLVGEKLLSNYTILKEEIRKIPGIETVSGASFAPGRVNWHQGCYWEGMPEDVDNAVYVISVDQDFVEAAGIKIIDTIPYKNQRTKTQLYFLNQTAVKELGIQNPLGKKFSISYKRPDKGQIIGVVENFNFKSLHQEMAPCVFLINNDDERSLFVRINPINISNSLDKIKTVLQKIDQNMVFEYHFVDQQFSDLYANEKRTKAILTLFTAFTLLISLMGIYGLFDFLTEKRIKEISIRKILGGSSLDIVSLILRQPIIIIIISSIIAVPIAFIIMTNWLQNFAYRIELNIEPFALAIGVMSFASILAILKVVISVLRRNPAETLRYE